MTRSPQDDAVREFFGTEAATYDQRHYGSRYRTFFADRLRLFRSVLLELNMPARSRILDLACGPGHLLDVITETGAVAVGLDSSADMLRTSLQRLGPPARLVRGDAFALPFENGAFDAVTCSGLIEYLPEPAPMLSEIHRVLRTGGHALVSSTNRISAAVALVPLVDAARRSTFVRAAVRASGLRIGERSLRSRRFKMAFHSPRALARAMRQAGFDELRMHYFHFQLLPHPLGRLLPSAAALCVRAGEPALRVPLVRALAEGILSVGCSRNLAQSGETNGAVGSGRVTRSAP